MNRSRCSIFTLRLLPLPYGSEIKPRCVRYHSPGKADLAVSRAGLTPPIVTFIAHLPSNHAPC